MLNLKDMRYYSEDVGKVLKSTVHEYCWEFIIEEKRVCIQYFIHKISNIRKVVYNQQILKEEHSGKNNTYSYEFTIDGHHYKIIQSINYLTELYIDGYSFDYNYTLERNKKEFTDNKRENVCNILSGENDNTIQASNEIKFIKNYKPKQILNLSFDIKKSNDNNIIQKQNNLNKFKFDSGENIKTPFVENNNITKYQKNNNNNLIDFDNFNKKDNINKNNNIFDNNFNFENNNNNTDHPTCKSNFHNNSNILNNLENDIFFSDNEHDENLQENKVNIENMNISKYNLNKINSLSDDYLFNNDNNNDININNNIKCTDYTSNITQNNKEMRNDISDNIKYMNSNNFYNNLKINEKDNNIKNDFKNIDISYYGF